ncbi:SH3 domain-containing protein [Oceaniglobus roseus]|uniref:SH3 domain-containing protein n=1 Tax=Oceaniglobus roseus TaxID=1737570 RepID=UPI0012FFF350|nr:SH3 domain-containing protein [Kandeliimicrobium roseum]
MLRLTLLLIAGIGLAMYVFGQPRNGAHDGGMGGPIAAAEASTTGGRNAPELLMKVSNIIGSIDKPTETAERVPLDDEKRAIEIALAATEARTTPAEAPKRRILVQSAAAELPVGEATASAGDAGDMWFVTGSRVNLRAGPSTSDSVVGQVVEGDLAEVLEENGGWYRIRTSDGGQTGFIYGKFLSAERPG